MIDLFTSVSGEPGPDEQVAERKRVEGRLSNPEPPVVQALLRLEFGRGIVLLQPQEAVMLRDELQAIDDPSAVRLATQIDVAATMLLAARLRVLVAGVDDMDLVGDEAARSDRGLEDGNRLLGLAARARATSRRSRACSSR